MIAYDCDAPQTANFKDMNQCKLVIACQARLKDVSIPVSDDVKAACDKAFSDWKVFTDSRARDSVSEQEKLIKSLSK
jgi:hypothetical protein